MLVLGHRGLGQTSQNASLILDDSNPPENSIASIEKALSMGADGVEIDVILSADGDLAVIHDNALNLHLFGADRLKQDKGFVSDKAMSELKGCNLGVGQTIPSLSDVFQSMAQYPNKMLNIELKGAGTHQKALEIALEFVARGAIKLQNIIFSSFSFDELVALRALNSNIKIGMLFEASLIKEEPMFKDASEGAFYRHFKKELVLQYWDCIKPTSLHVNTVDMDDSILRFAREKNCEIFCGAMMISPCLLILLFQKFYQIIEMKEMFILSQIVLIYFNLILAPLLIICKSANILSLGIY